MSEEQLDALEAALASILEAEGVQDAGAAARQTLIHMCDQFGYKNPGLFPGDVQAALLKVYHAAKDRADAEA